MDSGAVTGLGVDFESSHPRWPGWCKQINTLDLSTKSNGIVTEVYGKWCSRCASTSRYLSQHCAEFDNQNEATPGLEVSHHPIFE